MYKDWSFAQLHLIAREFYWRWHTGCKLIDMSRITLLQAESAFKEGTPPATHDMKIAMRACGGSSLQSALRAPWTRHCLGLCVLSVPVIKASQRALRKLVCNPPCTQNNAVVDQVKDFDSQREDFQHGSRTNLPQSLLQMFRLPS